MAEPTDTSSSTGNSSGDRPDQSKWQHRPAPPTYVILRPHLRLLESHSASAWISTAIWLTGIISTGVLFNQTNTNRAVLAFSLTSLIAIALLVVHVVSRRRLNRLVRHADFEVCPHCRYVLRGLSAIGECPECGKDYDRDVARQAWQWLANAPRSKSYFWERQFKRPATSDQVLFDVMLGLLLPVICVMLDPVVFRGPGRVIPADASHFVLSAIIIELPLLGLWLLLQDRRDTWQPVAGGALFAGALLSIIIGIIMFPFSTMGLVVCIGVLGFTPLFTAFVFVRNGIRAIGLDRFERWSAPWWAAVAQAICGLLGVYVLALISTILGFGAMRWIPHFQFFN